MSTGQSEDDIVLIANGKSGRMQWARRLGVLQKTFAFSELEMKQNAWKGHFAMMKLGKHDTNMKLQSLVWCIWCHVTLSCYRNKVLAPLWCFSDLSAVWLFNFSWNKAAVLAITYIQMIQWPLCLHMAENSMISSNEKLIPVPGRASLRNCYQMRIL